MSSGLPGVGPVVWAEPPKQDEDAKEFVTGVEIRRGHDQVDLVVTKQRFAIRGSRLEAVGAATTTVEHLAKVGRL